jgi:hypothetical protein
VIRIERVALPAGLRAIAQRENDGILVIYVSDGLDAQRQRAAVMAAVRASRRAGWRGAVPVGGRQDPHAARVRGRLGRRGGRRDRGRRGKHAGAVDGSGPAPAG